jgi:GNAT superfamily N-acetyltransferase
MRIEPFDPVADTEKVRACYELYAAGLPADDPGAPGMSRPAFCGWFSLGWTGAPREAYLVAGGGSGADRSARGRAAPAGAYLLELPVTENEHLGTLSIWVAPSQRRAGLGTALLQHAAARMRAADRGVLAGEARQGSAGAAFAAAMGASAGLTDVQRVLDLDDVPAARRLAALRHQADAGARGYSLLSWAGHCPDAYVDQIAAVSNALADAPRLAGVGPEVMDVDRYRQTEHRIAVQGLRPYTVAARCDATGALVGLSQLSADPERPGWGFQELTAVARQHRGHRLGLLLKMAMLDVLADAEPSMRRILTGNAEDNKHMIAINIEMGFRVLSYWSARRLDVAQVPAAS